MTPSDPGGAQAAKRRIAEICLKPDSLLEATLPAKLTTSPFFVRVILLLADQMVPPGDTPKELVGNLCRMGWRAVPAGIQEPAPGDIWVKTGPERQPLNIGFVAKLSLDKTWFYALDADTSLAVRMRREDKRIQCAEIDYWLTIPCSACEAARLAREAAQVG